MQTQANKRIVSKSEFAAKLGAKTIAFSVGVICYPLGVFGLALTLVWGIGLIAFVSRTVFHIATIAGGGLVSTMILLYGRRTIQASRKIDTGVPLTRANTADLPAPDSLVRASSEPVQAQEAVLLRAAAQGQEPPPEQLVRAATLSE